ncbi:unnamed protein product [Hermetia illucens]|uniref:Uncharacterized protein n=1 Tax=Hermetia illucens TaxID=343691 RepID=A0A7R8YYG6_HERIL|nr:unnamed protein product [Hermetia illucens]
MADDLSEVYENHAQSQKDILFKLLNPEGLSEDQEFSIRGHIFKRQGPILDYLYGNPEIQAIIRIVFNELLKEQPSNIPKYIADFFKRPKCELNILISENISKASRKSCGLGETTAKIPEGRGTVRFKELSKSGPSDHKPSTLKSPSEDWDTSSISTFSAELGSRRSVVLHETNYR